MLAKLVGTQDRVDRRISAKEPDLLQTFVSRASG